MTHEAGKPVRLDTERFHLRSLHSSDATARYAAWLNDPEVTRFLQVRFSGLQGVATIRDYIDGHDNVNRFLLGIFDREKDLHIGNYSLRLRRVHLTGNQGTMIGDKDYWGKGVVLETRAALLDFCFDDLGLDKVNGAVLSRNGPALYNYRRQGWVVEGIRKAQFICDDERVDCVQFSMFRDHWRRQ